MREVPPRQTGPERGAPPLHRFHVRQSRHPEKPEEPLLRHARPMEPGRGGIRGHRPGRLPEGGRIQAVPA